MESRLHSGWRRRVGGHLRKVTEKSLPNVNEDLWQRVKGNVIKNQRFKERLKVK